TRLRASPGYAGRGTRRSAADRSLATRTRVRRRGARARHDLRFRRRLRARARTARRIARVHGEPAIEAVAGWTSAPAGSEHRPRQCSEPAARPLPDEAQAAAF